MPHGSEIAILAPNIIRTSPWPRRFTKRGRIESLTGLDDAGLLARAFRIEASRLASAPLHYLGVTGTEPDGYCLFAYPVYLHVRREQLILMAGGEFEPSETEASSLVAAISEHFPEWRIERTPDAMWFVILDEAPRLETTPLQEVLGKDINDHLPRGGDAMEWHKVLNEIQMLLFNSQVNQDREQAGQPPLNSLWFWGGGRLPDIRVDRWKRVVTNDPVALGIGRRADIESRWLDGEPRDADVGSTPVTEPDTLWVYSQPGGSESRTSVLSKRQWNALRNSLRRRDIERLTLIEPRYGELTLSSGRNGRWWWPWH